jgi:hypothetical protein
MDKNKQIQNIVTSYISEHELSNRRLVDEINDQLGDPSAITIGAVGYWRSGKSLPRPFLIEVLYQRSEGPTKEFALDILKVLKPDEYGNGR